MAAAAAPANMNEYLEQTLGVTNEGMRNKLHDSGFRTLDALVNKPKDFARQACQTIRKSRTGNAGTREVTMEIEPKQP